MRSGSEPCPSFGLRRGFRHSRYYFRIVVRQTGTGPRGMAPVSIVRGSGRASDTVCHAISACPPPQPASQALRPASAPSCDGGPSRSRLKKSTAERPYCQPVRHTDIRTDCARAPGGAPQDRVDTADTTEGNTEQVFQATGDLAVREATLSA